MQDRPPPSRTLSVRLRLVFLVLAVMVPTAIAAVLAIVHVYQQERRGFERTLAEATRALSLVVDRELLRRESILKTLAESPTLDRDDLEAFYVFAREIAPHTDTTIVLADLQNQQLLNTRRPFGEKLPVSTLGPLRQAAGPLATVISDLYFAPIGKQYSFAVQVPVVRNGQVRYYLAMGSYVSHMQQVLLQQRLPEGWVGTIIDRRGVVVARTLNHERFVNQRPSPEWMKAAEGARGQAVRLRSMEGTSMLASFYRAPGHGWGVFIGVPEEQITSPARTAALFAGVAAVLLAAALGAATWVGRRLVTPITRLSRAAEALGRGEAVELQPTGLEETDRVAQALHEASTSIRAATERQEERVQQALAEAERAHRAMVQNQRLEAIGQLTGGVAHDFNNLLMVVNTNVHLLRARNPGLAQDAQLGRIERAVATGSKLTRQLLAFSRRQPLRPDIVDLSVTLPELMDLIRPSLSSTIRAHCKVEPGTSCIEVDPAELELAVINLAVNARDAMPGGGELSIEARNSAGRPGFVEIEVRDTGVGIPPELVDRVFEPFFTTKEVGRGTGLGLSQVYGLATQAGGSASLRSAPGKGTSVLLHLPARERREPRDATWVGGGREALRCDVLLVEDNAELAQATTELLMQAGCRVVHVPGAEHALRALQDTRLPDVVLSDIRMPGALDGLALARHVRQAHPGVAVLLMTGYTAELQAARDSGLEVLAKPVAPYQLLAAVAGAVARDGRVAQPADSA